MNSTQLSSSILNTFNQSETVLVISKYPFADVQKSYHGVATYTQHQLESITKQTDQKFVVLVQREYDRPVEKDEKNQLLVIPTFGKTKFMFWELLRMIHQFPSIKVIHIHSEFFTSGDPIQMALVIPFLALLKFFGKKVIFIAHNVVDNFDFIANHLGKSSNDLQLQLLQQCVPWYYRILSVVTDELVVLDNSVKTRLEKFISGNSVYLSPHWIHPQHISNREKHAWRKKLGFKDEDFILVCFGFMTSYKGVDWLVEAVEHLRKQPQFSNLKLILAGGRAPSQSGKIHYEKFYAQLAQRVAKSTTTILTDFVPENEMKNYFAAADVVVLPYRGILGASGSWAQALAHGKPCLISQEIEAYLHSPDVKSALQKAKLQTTDIVFHRNRRSLGQLLKQLNPSKLKQFQKFAKNIAAERQPEKAFVKDYQALYTPQPSFFSLQLSRGNTFFNQSLRTLFAS